MGEDAQKLANALGVTCPKCEGEAQAPHTCPFRSDINNDHETLCDCCEGCSYGCAMEV
jgi:hypothetical protein